MTIENGVRIVWDEVGDTLYVRMVDAEVARLTTSSNDPELVLEYDRDGAIVGVTVLGVTILGYEWEEHPDRAQIPPRLDAVISKYALGNHDQPRRSLEG